MDTANQAIFPKSDDVVVFGVWLQTATNVVGELTVKVVAGELSFDAPCSQWLNITGGC